MLKKNGTIVKWNDDKGYGFILPQNSKQHIFVHIKSFVNRSSRPSINQSVVYTISENKDGKQSAVNVTRVTDNLLGNTNNNKKKKNISLKSISNNNSNYAIDYKSSHKINIAYIIFVLSFLGFLLYFSINGKLPLYTIVFYGIISIITYFSYSIDKSKAITKEYRTSEKSLHLLSLIGGWMGAIIAQQRFRHKNKKISFQIVFWMTVIFNVSILIHKFNLL